MIESLKDKFKEKKILWILFVLIISLLLILVLYSNAFLKPTPGIPAKVGINVSTCTNFTFSSESSSINLTNTSPMTDNKGLQLNPYTFTISNTCTENSSFNVYLIVANDSQIDDNLIRYNLSTTNEIDSITGLNMVSLDNTVVNQYQIKTGKTARSVYLLDTKTLTPSSSLTFNLKLWLSSEAGNELQNKTFTATIAVGDSETSGEILKFNETILVNNGGVTAIEAKGTPNFANVATTNEGMYAAQDDYGTSYYFRGAVDNNWVEFANMYWRIIRINGDGSVRMIYTGTTAPTESQKVVMTGTGTQIGPSAFNSSSNNNMYVGYMYTSGEVHGLGTPSTIKGVIDPWYQANLSSRTNSLADNLFCNDRSAYLDESGTTTGGGTGATETNYGAYIRNVTNKQPILTCPTKSDAFTVTDTTKGNGALDYPIGLITADEIAMAGGVFWTSNTNFYLNTNQWYWSFSPFNYSSSYASVFSLNSAGKVDYNHVYNAIGGRAVVSLKSDILTTGSGTWDDPYIVL